MRSVGGVIHLQDYFVEDFSFTHTRASSRDKHILKIHNDPQWFSGKILLDWTGPIIHIQYHVSLAIFGLHYHISRLYSVASGQIALNFMGRYKVARFPSVYSFSSRLQGYLVFINFLQVTSTWVLISVLLNSYYYSFICKVISPWNLALFVPKHTQYGTVWVPHYITDNPLCHKIVISFKTLLLGLLRFEALHIQETYLFKP